MEPHDSILAVEPLTEPSGIEIVDRLEQLRYTLQTPEPISPTPVPPEEFLFPVGTGVAVTTDRLTLPDGVSLFVRDGDGEMVTEVDHLESVSLEEGSYILDFSTQIKTYMQIEGPVDISVTFAEIELAFDRPTRVEIGLRSRHSRPAATVTTTSDPTDLMTAVSTFGSALKSTTPELSFPTLRGHPPLVELGSSVHVPDRIEPPATDVWIELPPAVEYVLPVAPLAYYLGAEVVPGPAPLLRTGSGFEYSLSGATAYETAVERTLKQIFLLDCLASTEGFYSVDLHERAVLDAKLEFDWASLYDRPIAQRVKRYLEVPYEVIEPQVPQWRLTAHVPPTSESVEQLPFVVDDLAVVRTRAAPAAGTTASSPTTGQSTDEEALTRSAGAAGTRSTAGGDSPEERHVQFEPADSFEQAWLGPGIPIGASKPTRAAFQNRLEREVGPGSISITIVVNDERMAAESDLVENVYGNRDDLPFDVTVCRDLGVEGLRERLAEDCDFLHYVGHADAEGFECPDGKLDVRTLDHSGVDSFLLNACSSYEHGLALVESGTIGGIVTLTDVINEGAVRIGETIARLLNAGFPLRASLAIARDQSVLGGQYIVVGDGGMTVTQAPGRTPNLLDVSRDGEEYLVEIVTYATDTAGLGSMYYPLLEDNSEYYLSSGTLDTFRLTPTELAEYFDMQNVPVRFRDELRWSYSLSLSNVD